MLLMDRLFRKQGLRPDQCSPLDRLSFVGHRGMGALTYEPDSQAGVWPDAVDLLALANETALVLQGEDTETLQRLALLGGSPQGARPKVLVFYDPATALISTTSMPSGTGWLVKFQALGEHKEVCAIEAFYAQLARTCGLEVPRTHVFDLSIKQAALGIERFDLALQCMQIAPAMGVVIDQLQHCAQAFAHGFFDRVLCIEQRLLRHIGDAKPVLNMQLTIVGALDPGQDLEQGRLACAVAANQADAFTRFEREAGPIQQSDVAVGQRGVQQSDE
jgi:hypothetical protein